MKFKKKNSLSLFTNIFNFFFLFLFFSINKVKKCKVTNYLSMYNELDFKKKKVSTITTSEIRISTSKFLIDRFKFLMVSSRFPLYSQKGEHNRIFFTVPITVLGFEQPE